MIDTNLATLLALGVFVLGVLAPRSEAGQNPEAVPPPPQAVLHSESLDPVLPAAAYSMGQPSRGRLSWGFLLGYQGESKDASGRLYVDATRGEVLPFLRLLETTGEASAGVVGSRFDSRLGVYIGLPLLMAGVNYDFQDQRFPFAMSARFPLKRGGLLGHGDLFRIDYRPVEQEIQFGLTLRSPFETYRKTRPQSTAARLPSGEVASRPAESSLDSLSLDLQSHLTEIEQAVAWMDRLLTPKFENEDTLIAPKGFLEHIRQGGHDFWGEDSIYHHALDAAFVQAVSGDSALGLRLAAQAESVIFEDVVGPFDQRFCQVKTPNHAGGYCRRAQEAFARVLAANPRFAPEGGVPAQRLFAEDIFRRTVLAIERASRAATDRWRRSVLFWHTRDSLAWLPLNYGLRRPQYDTQEEWDSVLARMTHRPFTDANTVEYLLFDQFHPRLKQMIRKTRKYQVTIVHDFRGYAGNGHTDLYGWDMVVDGYLQAFIDAVDRCDTGGVLPQFFLFLDENYYRVNRSRGIISYLENLYDGPVPSVDDAGIREQIVVAHDRLIEKIKHSRSLSHLTQSRLRELFKVYINITNPFDPAFFKDVTRRDHRKIAFCDVFEDAPGMGSAIFTGQGIGDHYNGNAWDDRSMLVRGPSLVELKSATRELFLSQGFDSTEVPEYLKPRPYPPNYAARCDSLRSDSLWTTPVNISMNETGYGDKEVSVLKAAIYNLVPPQGVLQSFDSLWTSEFWASMLVGAALRGAHIYVVAPTPRSAPSSATPTLYFLRRNLLFLFHARTALAEYIGAHHGLLRVGLYSQDIPVNDLAKRTGQFMKGRMTNAFLQEEFPFDQSIGPLLAGKIQEYKKNPALALQLRPHPFLHLKTQFFGTREAFEVTRFKQWGPILKKYIALRDNQQRGLPSGGITPQLLRDCGLTCQALRDSLRQEGPGAEDRAIFTFSIGSHNQDPRSQFLDAETAVTLSGCDCLVSAIDCQLLLAISDWPQDEGAFIKLFPPIHLGILAPIYRLLEDQS